MLEDVGDADVIICVEQVVTDARFHRSHQINNLPHRPRVSVNVAPLFVCLPTKAGETRPESRIFGLRCCLQETCSEHGLQFASDPGRGFGFQRWVASLICDHEGVEEDKITTFTTNDLKFNVIIEDDDETAEWLAQQIVEAFPWNAAPAYLVRDNDGAFGQAFRRRVFERALEQFYRFGANI
jgi:hypothetical protein